MKKIIFIFFFLFAYTENVHSKKNVQEEANKKTYCRANTFFFTDNLNKIHYPKKIKIETNQIKTWYLNLIRSFYSTPRSNWKIDPEYKKYTSAKVSFVFDNNIICKFKGKVKIHGGRKDHIDLKNLTSSLRVKLFDGHINHSRHFALLRPFSRNSDNEIFITTLLSKINIITPNTYYIDVKVNNNNSQKMIFQDMDYEEVLRINKRSDGIILAENKTVYNNKHTLTRTLNVESQPYGTGWEKGKNYFFNALDKSNFIFINEKFYNKKNILHGEDEIYFVDYKKFKDFYLIMLASGGMHGAQFGDRRYYYNIIKDMLEPVYYDWKPKIFTEDYVLENHTLIYNFTISDIDNLIQKISELNYAQILNELKEKKLAIKKNDLILTKEKLIKNLLKIKTIKKNQNLSEYKNFEYPNYLLYHKNQNNYEICDLANLCKSIQINEKNEKEILKNHEYIIEGNKIKFVRKNKKDFKENILPEKHSINNMRLVELKNTKVYYNNSISIDKSNNKLDVKFLDNNGRIFFVGGKMVDYKIFINQKKTKTKKQTSNNQDNNTKDNYIPYCIAFYDVKIKNLDLKAKNLDCLKGIRFIKSSGTVNNVKIFNSNEDSLSAELSELTFNEVNISGSQDDCIDFESGDYYFKKILLSKCEDKAIQIKRKANVKIDYLKIDNSSYGLSVHDSSYLLGKEFRIASKKECLSIYRENDSFYGAKVEVEDEFICSNNKNFIHKGSKFLIKNVIQN